jgi:hypothetical protein
VLDELERRELESWSRPRIIPMATDGHNNIDIAARVGMSNSVIGYWRGRFLTDRLTGLYDELRPGTSANLDVNNDGVEDIADLVMLVNILNGLDGRAGEIREAAVELTGNR